MVKSQDKDKNCNLSRWHYMSPERVRQERDKELKIQIRNLIEGAQQEYERQESHITTAAQTASVLMNEVLPALAVQATPDAQAEHSLQQSQELSHCEGQLIQQPQARQTAQLPQPVIDQAKDANPTSARLAKAASQKKARIEEVIGLAAAKIARDIDADNVISIEQKTTDADNQDKEHANVLVSIFSKAVVQTAGEDKVVWNKMEYSTKMKKLMTDTVMPIKELLMEAINKKYIKKGERVVCVEDESLGMGYKGLLFIFDVDQVFFNLSTSHLTENLDGQSVEAIINLAMEIGREGREGRHVGTAFVIGPMQELSPFLKPLNFNPFAGAPEDKRRVADPEIRETIKEFAQLDGVFIVNEKGVLQSAATYLQVDITGMSLPQGYGTRHRCCCAITQMTSAIAIVVSESGGRVTAFKNGKVALRHS
jgi:DNA integrity scanning protein DisA with diadenylate cyclase activity